MNVIKLDHAKETFSQVKNYGDVTNPAFLRFNPAKNLVYACTETIKEPGQIVSYSLQKNGELKQLSSTCAEGYSTCYLTFDKEKENILVVNYWDSLLGTLPLAKDGTIQPMKTSWKPPRKMVADNLDSHLAQRQSEPHTHALVFEPFQQRVAFVPDLGDDCIKQFVYDKETGRLEPAGRVPAGALPHTKKGGGPRYVEFHHTLPILYMVNEIASSVSVYECDVEAMKSLKPGDSTQTLKLVQEITTIPEDFDQTSTCGRIAVDKSGQFVLTSNRGHDSVCVHKINPQTGRLSLVNYFPSGGKTPRHFQQSEDGKWVFVANQDSNLVSSFKFDQKSGVMTHFEDLPVDSPNFVLALDASTGFSASSA